MNPPLALAELRRTVSNRFEETCACGGVNVEDAIEGILQTLAKVCHDKHIEQILVNAASQVKPKPDLNQYAGTIARVFEQIAKLYDEGESGPVSDTVESIVMVLDADVCGEIIQVAQRVEDQS